DDINTYNKDINGKYEMFNSALSSGFKRNSNRFSFTPGIEFKVKNFVITPAVRALFQHVVNDVVALPAPIVQKQNDLLPSFTVVYKQLNFNYSRDVTLPPYNYLIPVADNTNSYFIVKGNSDLTPTRRDAFSINYNYNDTKRSLNAGGW